jgi:isoleucyl-tRNA synthetase
VLDGSVSSVFRLTDKGRQQVADSAKNFKKLHEDVLIDLVIVSPILRTRETADIFIENFGLTKDKIVIDERIREYDPGILDGHKISELKDIINGQDRFTWKPDGGENYQDIKKRMGDFLYEMENKYSNKSILIVTHETPALLLFSSAYGLTLSDTKSLRPSGDFIANAEIRKLDFTPLPHNDRHELDLHRPFIDDLQLRTDEGNRLVRVPDVFDCWFESGAMPYASNHYPFENVGFEPKPGPFKKPRGYPADFIAEGLDQTRGWFYSMMVLGVALFGKTPYKKVIVNGLVLAEDGQKMSKRKQNYPDPMRLVDKYGADSLRFYLLSSPVVHGEDLCFSERGVDEVTKKIVNRLLNVVSFYEMYVGGLKARDILSKVSSSNVLDLWILNRLNETISIVTKALEAGELDKAVRPFMDFTDDLSTWYIRRSRDRFKALADKTAKVDYPNDEDKDSALATTCFVLLTTAKILAPFMPFLSEEIYSRVGGDLESVHLEEWPTANAVDSTSIGSMNIVRGISSKALEARMKVKINVRQPLAKLKVRDTNLKDLGASLIGLIKDEVNIKEVSFDSTIVNDIELDTVITPELKEEGIVRELIRIIQDLRKKKGLTMNDRVVLFVGTDNVGKDLVEKNRSKLMATTSLREIKYDGTGSEEFRIGDLVFRLSI